VEAGGWIDRVIASGRLCPVSGSISCRLTQAARPTRYQSTPPPPAPKRTSLKQGSTMSSSTPLPPSSPPPPRPPTARNTCRRLRNGHAAPPPPRRPALLPAPLPVPPIAVRTVQQWPTLARWAASATASIRSGVGGGAACAPWSRWSARLKRRTSDASWGWGGKGVVLRGGAWRLGWGWGVMGRGRCMWGGACGEVHALSPSVCQTHTLCPLISGGMGWYDRSAP